MSPLADATGIAIAYISAVVEEQPGGTVVDKHTEADTLEARRRFLAKCGKFAAITPPAMTLLLSSTAQNYAVAASGNGSVSLSGNNGFGNGGNDGVPGNSGNNPSPQAGSKKADEVR